MLYIHTHIDIYIYKLHTTLLLSIIFEINSEGNYRIKQLKGNTYKMLSGTDSNNGWVTNKIINDIDKHNKIEIRVEAETYEIYINNNYLTKFLLNKAAL